MNIAIEPMFKGLVLSGAGGSWIENIIFKQSPVPIAPLAKVLLGHRLEYLHDEIETMFERFEVVWPPEIADRR